MLPIISLKERKGTIYAYNIKGVRIYKKEIYYFLWFNNREEERKENRKKWTRLVDKSNKRLYDGNRIDPLK